VKIGIIVIVFAAFLPQPASATGPQLDSDTTLSTAGYFRLTWHDAPGAEYELQQSRSNSFDDARTLYHGRDQASVISGLADGHYYYRIGNTATGQWSKPLEIEVKHHPLTRAFGFFSLGAVMFLATLGVLISGTRRQGQT